ncbi:MAG: cation-translocating P-type ATPase, partial [Chitinophagaceae bacterium]|nr:cation-translocating P-type ATPase [Chitinophagaceae bacterium]
MEKVQWKVEGMTCSNCALTIHKYLQQQGAQNVAVNLIDGDVSFELNGNATPETIAKGIETLGYKVDAPEVRQSKTRFLSTHLHRFLFCLPFTAILMLHMFRSLHHHPLFSWIMNPWINFALVLPVFIVGMNYFGRSAINSIRNGMPNMNVLITIGAASAFIYSFIGTILNLGTDYLFYETSATIITLVFLGNYLEDASIQSTQRSLKALAKSQKVMANIIAFDEHHHEVILPVESTQLKVGDLVLIKNG